MSDASKAILQQANARIVEGDYEGFLAHCTDGVVLKAFVIESGDGGDGKQ